MLTQAHVRALRDNPSATVRADIAAAVGSELAAGALSPSEARIAAAILETLTQDVERQVRQALAEEVKGCPFLPREIARTLARDVEDQVALPLLEHSPLLDDADLVAFVRGGATPRQLAVARRRTVPDTVADALVDTGKPEVVGAVLANDGAELSEHALLKAAGEFRGDPAIERLIVERPSLPLTVCESLMATVAEALRRRLVEKHRIPEFLAAELTLHGRERAVAALLPGESAEAAEHLASHLHARKRLTASLVLRALCHGDLCFFDAAMGTLAGVPTASARTLLYDRGPGGLRAIYRTASLPGELFRAFRVAVNAVLDGELRHGRAAYAEHIVGRLVVLYDGMAPGGIDVVLAQLGRRAVETPP